MQKEWLLTAARGRGFGVYMQHVLLNTDLPQKMFELKHICIFLRGCFVFHDFRVDVCVLASAQCSHDDDDHV